MNGDRYIIAKDGYMYNACDMYEFVGTYRELLEHLNGVDDSNRDSEPDEADGRFFPKDYSDTELEHYFVNANGDGQPYYMVWSEKEGKKVLG